jgi:phthalate 4,5-cis-dihydrodiol dehydrogenase
VGSGPENVARGVTALIANKEKSNRSVRIGVIGLGMAGAAMVPAIEAHPDFILAGAADPNPELRVRFARDHACPVDASAAELVQRTDIEAVYVATPHQWHREHAVLAARTGKHAIVEKPMALSLEDCDEMIEAFERSGTALLVGHTHSFDPAIRLMRELIAGSEVGRLSMIAMANYTDFIYRPRRPEELDTSLGGGILFNQIPHQVDIARLLSGSEVRQVRATTGILDRNRPTEGSCMAMLSFEDGAAASLIYSGYDRFDSDELHGWIGESGQPKNPNHGATGRALARVANGAEEARIRSQKFGYGGARRWQPEQGERWHQPHFGTLVVSCEKADLRQSADGVLIYTDSGVRELAIPLSKGRPGRADVLDELYQAIVNDVAPPHDGKFARGTLEVCLAIQESSRSRREITLASAYPPVASPSKPRDGMNLTDAVSL